MTAHDSKTLDFYATEAPRYHARSTAPINCELPGFLARLAPGASILELGCGGGRDAAYIEAAGFAVDPTDGVPAMAVLAAERLGRPVRVMRFDQLDAVAAYDAVYASYSLLHVPRAGLLDVLRRVHAALKPSGWHMATFKSGGHEGRDDFDRYFNYLAREEARACYAAAGDWQTMALTEGEGEGYDGRVSPWVTVVAQKVDQPERQDAVMDFGYNPWLIVMIVIAIPAALVAGVPRRWLWPTMIAWIVSPIAVYIAAIARETAMRPDQHYAPGTALYGFMLISPLVAPPWLVICAVSFALGFGLRRLVRKGPPTG